MSTGSRGAASAASSRRCYASGEDAAGVDAVCYEELVRRNPFRDYTIPRVSRSLVGAASKPHFSAISASCTSRSCRGNSRSSAPTCSVEPSSSTAAVSSRMLCAHRCPYRVSSHPHGCPARSTSTGVCSTICPLAHSTKTKGRSSPSTSRPREGRPTAPGQPRMPSLPETLVRSMLMGSAPAAAAARKHAAVVVTPDCRGIGLLEFHQIDRAVEAGRVAGRAAIEALARLAPLTSPPPSARVCGARFQTATKGRRP